MYEAGWKEGIHMNENIYLSLDSNDFYNISKVLSLINFDQAVLGVDVSTLAGKCKEISKNMCHDDALVLDERGCVIYEHG